MFLSFPAGTKMFQFPAFAPVARYTAFDRVGSPIQKSPDHFLFADPRSLSQLTTSFFAFGSQGILRSLLFSFSYFVNHMRLLRLILLVLPLKLQSLLQLEKTRILKLQTIIS